MKTEICKNKEDIQLVGLDNMNTFVNYAHRGASAYAPENTMAAFKKAFQIGANGIELDLQKTKDGKIVIFHDNKIDKKSNGTGKISDYTYKELLEFDFGSWFSNEFENEKIVLFEDFMKEVSDKNLILAIELKEEGIEKETLEIINEYYDKDNIFITSFIYNALSNVRKLDKNIKIGWLIKEEINQKNILEFIKISGNQICPPANLVSDDGIKLARKNNLSVRLWGVSNEEIMNKVFNLDIDGMTVNFPDKLKQLMTENNLQYELNNLRKNNKRF